MRNFLMDRDKKFLRVVICITLFLFLYNFHKIFISDLLKREVSSLINGTSVVFESLSHSKGWRATNLIYEEKERGWLSEKNSPFPHVFVFELISTSKIYLLRFNNLSVNEKQKKRTSKKIKVEFSNIGPESDYVTIGTFVLKENKEKQEIKIPRSKAKWIRLSILSNYGHPNYTELLKFEAWGVPIFHLFRIISNFIWVLGISLTLAAFSFNEFLSYKLSIKRKELFKRDTFKKPVVLGLVLIVFGIIVSVQVFWLSLALMIPAVLLLFWAIKLYASKKTKSQEA